MINLIIIKKIEKRKNIKNKMIFDKNYFSKINKFFIFLYIDIYNNIK